MHTNFVILTLIFSELQWNLLSLRSSGGILRDRSQATCRRLWEVIPPAYRASHCFSDFWAVYQDVIPEEQHTAVGKETGETAHVERWNNTLRQRLARFVRKTLSFSKALMMHEACLNLFLHRYNRCRELAFLREPLSHMTIAFQ